MPRLIEPARADALRAEASRLSTRTLDATERDVLDGLLRGLFGPLDGYPDAAARASIASAGTLPGGVACGVAPELGLSGLDAMPGDRVALRDAEGVLLAVLAVTEIVDGLVAGTLEGAALPEHADHPELRRTVDELRVELAGAGTGTGAKAEVLVAPRALHTADLDGLATGSGPLVLVSVPPAGADPDPLVAAHGAATGLLRGEGRTVHRLLAPRPVAAATPEMVRPEDDDEAAGPTVASPTVADEVLAVALGGTLLPLAPSTDDHAVVEALRAGRAVGAELSPPEVVEVLARAFPSRLRQGVCLLFTGLSGSGKSTVGALVAARMRERGRRPVTLLDGDVVRTHLSRGLGFSAADRDTNVRRIGWVGAQLARHGGLVVAAPIAPYAAARADVRRMVSDAGGAYVEVHVATPLAVCEARDRKGLYARARAGELRGFTGIDDPYEVPSDPDLRLDTSERSAEAACLEVLELLVRRGHVDPEVLVAADADHQQHPTGAAGKATR